MKAGLVSITFRQLSVEKIVRIVSEAGLEGVEWGGDVHVPHGDIKRAGEVKRMTSDSGLETSAYGSYYKFQEHNRDSATKGPEMEAVLDSAEALGAPSIRIWAGEIGAAEASDSWWGTVVEKTKEFAHHASRRGMRIDFEFHSNTLTDTNESTKKLLEDISHPGVQTLWQPSLGVSKKTQLEGLKMLQNVISNIHCFYWGPGGWLDKRLLVEGHSVWSDYLAILRQTGRERWISLEFVKDNAIENFMHDAQTLKRWLAAGNRDFQ